MKILAIILGIIFIPYFCFSLEVEWDTPLEDTWLVISARVMIPETIDLLANLEEGHQAEIHYQFRLYNEVKGLLAVFGDKLILSKAYTLTAYKHFFFNEYVIEDSDGKIRYYKDQAEFLLNFLTLSRYNFFHASGQNPADYYFLGNVSLVPVKLEPPLHIIALFPNLRLTAEGIKRYIYQQKE